MITIRRGSIDDVFTLLGKGPPDGWSVCEPAIWVAERDERPVAVGAVTVDCFGRFVVWIDRAHELPAMTLHREVRHAMTRLRDAGADALYANCDPAIPGAESWLRRLGFLPEPTMDSELGSGWKCALST